MPDIQPVDKEEATIPGERRFEELFRLYEPKLLAYALRRAPPEVAKDAVAETFLAAWRRFDQLSDDPLPWLIATARNALANQRRSAGRQLRLARRLAELPPERPPLDRHPENTSGTRDALDRLSPADREVLLLIGWDGLTPSQAAGSLGCSAAGFRVRLHRARRRFGRLLAEEQADFPLWCPPVSKEVSRL